MKQYAITLTHEGCPGTRGTGATFVRTMAANKVKRFTEKAALEGYVIRASRPVRG